MLLTAIDAIRSFSALPIVAQLTFSEEGTTLDGTRAGGSGGAPGAEERAGHRRELHAGPAIAAADSRRAGHGRAPAFGHAQRRVSQARGRPHRLSAIFAGIFRPVCARSGGAGRAHHGRLLRHLAGAHSRDGRGGEAAQVRRRLRRAESERARHGRARPQRSRAREARAGKPPVAEDAGARVRGFGGDRSAQGHLARSRLRAGGQSDGHRPRGRHRHQQRHAGARGHGRDDGGRRAGSARRARPFRTSPRAT